MDGNISTGEKTVRGKIRWAGLYDRNSDMQYAPRQLMQKKQKNISEYRKKKTVFLNLINYY